MILPIGLSFHTFQAMSYTIEVYRGNHKAERHFGIYALYVMFFPQLVAGPIERPQNILYQFHEKKYFIYENALLGFRLIAFGFFKKLVIADRVGIYVNQVYANYQTSNSLSIFTAILLFAVQIYTDFSGYSDIARGTAKVLGYDLLINFNYPFKSLSITDFWRRWHISLSTWFNDYLFTPLMISFRDWNKLGIALALLITFFLSGLWHGAGWTFIVYGLMHGIAMVYEFFTRKFRKKLFSKIPQKLNETMSMVLVWLYVSFSWVFFRSENMHQAFGIFQKLFNLHYHFKINDLYGSKGPVDFLIILFCLALYLGISKINKDLKLEKSLLFISLLFILIIILGKNGLSEFIYFQF
jgi:D-alanyl-lipoteichoic acid acyltransferase DltB (MBOAT superfamily)